MSIESFKTHHPKLAVAFGIAGGVASTAATLASAVLISTNLPSRTWEEAGFNAIASIVMPGVIGGIGIGKSMELTY